MPIDISCPTCHRSYSLTDDYLGKKVLCKSCQTPFVVEGGDVFAGCFDDLTTREPQDVPAEPIWDSFEPEQTSQNPYQRTPRESPDQPYRSNSNALIIVLVLFGFGVSAAAAGWFVVTLRAEQAREAREAREQWDRMQRDFGEPPPMNAEEREQWDRMNRHFDDVHRMVEEQQAEMEKSLQRHQELMERMQNSGWQEQQELMDRIREESLRRHQEHMERVRKRIEEMNPADRPRFPSPQSFP